MPNVATDTIARELNELIKRTAKRQGWYSKRNYASAMTECVYSTLPAQEGAALEVSWHWPTAKSRAYGVYEAALLCAAYRDAKGTYTKICQVEYRDTTGTSHQAECEKLTAFINTHFR